MFVPCFARENIGHLLQGQAIPAAPAAMASDASTVARNCGGLVEDLEQGVGMVEFLKRIYSPAVMRERFGASGIHISCIFPIKWGAKELLRVSQPSDTF